MPILAASCDPSPVPVRIGLRLLFKSFPPPTFVPKGSQRVGGMDEMINSLYAGDMTVWDIAYHLKCTVGTGLSYRTINATTDEVLMSDPLNYQRPNPQIFHRFFPRL